MQHETPQPVLVIRDTTKSFDSYKAVNAINIEVRKGEIFGFLGPNGAGKSTTIRLILDLLRPDSGTISLFGTSNRTIADVHKHIGFLSGDMALDTDLTGRQYLDFLDQLHGGNHAKKIQQLAELLEANLDKKIGNYSRGNRQKIGLIAAMLHNPRLLILDEPTSGFDPLVQEKFASLIRAYVAGGGTVFMSSHILAEVQHLCDRVAFIKDGRIVTTKSVQDLVENNARQIEIVANAAEIKKIQKQYKKVPGLLLMRHTETTIHFTYAGDISPLLGFFAPRKLVDMTIREPELEEIFGRYYETTQEDTTDA